MDAQLQHQSSDDMSSRADGSRRNGSLDGYAASREGSSLHTTHSGGTYHSFTQQGVAQQSRSAGAVVHNPFQAHQAAAARNGMRRYGSSDNLAGLGPPGHQRSGVTSELRWQALSGSRQSVLSCSEAHKHSMLLRHAEARLTTRLLMPYSAAHQDTSSAVRCIMHTRWPSLWPTSSRQDLAMPRGTARPTGRAAAAAARCGIDSTVIPRRC